MLATVLLLVLGIIIGLLLASCSFWIIKVKCPKCKQPKPLKEIVIFQWKGWEITGQPCLKCREIKPQVEIF